MALQQVLHLLQLCRTDRAALKDENAIHDVTLHQTARRVQRKDRLIFLRATSEANTPFSN